jgi:large subunit ribosomal protein L4
MNIDVFDINAKKVSSLALPLSVFGVKISPSLIAQSVRSYLSNQRKARPMTKNRAEVRGTTKKMWAQKGTGRARHGSAKAPIFVGGGIAHGPRGQQNYKLKMSKKMKKGALFSVLSQHAHNKNIIAIKSLSSFQPKTKSALTFLSKLQKDDKKVAIITSKPLTTVKRAFRNLPSVTILNLNSLSAYQLAKQNQLIFSVKAIKDLSSQK